MNFRNLLMCIKSHLKINSCPDLTCFPQPSHRLITAPDLQILVFLFLYLYVNLYLYLPRLEMFSQPPPASHYLQRPACLICTLLYLYFVFSFLYLPRLDIFSQLPPLPVWFAHFCIFVFVFVFAQTGHVFPNHHLASHHSALPVWFAHFLASEAQFSLGPT